MPTSTINNPKIVSRDEWLAARKKLLAREKQLTHERDAVAAERRQLPWVQVEKNYVFDSLGGKKTLTDLFDGRSQLIVYHFMFGPEWNEGCPSCSFNMDHTDGALVHLAQRDVSFAAISRAPLAKIEAFKKRMGWRFNWVSSYGTDFNYDYRASFTQEEMAKGKVDYNFDLVEFPSAEAPGFSVFYKDGDGSVFHTYSAYARGTENFVNTYNYLDLVPKGRDEDGLQFTMSWVRHHDRYADGHLADADRPYWPEGARSNA
ncbi:MAG TPA: thioredoxin family protein [Bryobacteraceae bacterium]|nr:thioredoxin family protein [Bryobacteraceae bacterium]